MFRCTPWPSRRWFECSARLLLLLPALGYACASSPQLVGPSTPAPSIAPTLSAVLVGAQTQLHIVNSPAERGAETEWQAEGTAEPRVSASGVVVASKSGDVRVSATAGKERLRWSTIAVPDASGEHTGTLEMVDCRRLAGPGTSPCRFLIGPGRTIRLSLNQSQADLEGTMEFALAGVGRASGGVTQAGNVTVTGVTSGGSADMKMTVSQLIWSISESCGAASMVAELRFENAFGPQTLEAVFGGQLCRGDSPMVR